MWNSLKARLGNGFQVFGCDLRKLRTIGPRAKAFATWPTFDFGTYEMVARLYKQGVLPGMIIDVGANTGQFAFAAAKFFPRAQVHSFEPLPEAVGNLNNNVSGLSNVTVYPLALGDHEGEATFHANTYSPASSFLPFTQTHRDVFPYAQETKSVKVKISTLDKVFADIELKPPALLKLDVQGYEPQVIRGGAETLSRMDYILMETSFEPLYQGELPFSRMVQLMEEQGFCFERPVGWIEASRTQKLLQMDVLFASAS